MNSFNHYAYGCVGDWMYRVVAGIDTDESAPGYKHILIKPQPSRELQWVSAWYNSMYGEIMSKWSFENGGFILEVAIPHNTTASVLLPFARLDTLEKCKTLEKYGITGVETGDGVLLELGSGKYSFRYPLSENQPSD
jgi:alpha-L-rhamnosidase